MYIYEPKGRAREYSFLALNIYEGCEHGCRYCYVPLFKNVDRKTFHTSIKPRINLSQFTKEAEILERRGETRNILLCFTCDPYQPIEQELEYTRKVIKILKQHNLNITVLTKGGLLATRDFDLYTDGDEFAVTLTFLDKQKSLEFEPNAALPFERIKALQEANSRGIYTWVSLEPVIDPKETLKIIDAVHEFVDEFRIGTINHSELKKHIDWNDFAWRLYEKLELYGNNYLIKNDLRPYFKGAFYKNTSLLVQAKRSKVVQFGLFSNK